METGNSTDTWESFSWKGDFNRWNTVRIHTIGDGNCFFHSLLNSFFVPYHNEKLNGKRVSRHDMARSLRRELALKLDQKVDPDDPNSPTNYDLLGRGNRKEFSSEVKELSLKRMKKLLDSSEHIGFGYIEYISNQLRRNIYILNGDKNDVYITGEESLFMDKERDSIVLYYKPGHYELVGIENRDGTISTIFAHDHPFIRFLRYRIRQLMSKEI